MKKINYFLMMFVAAIAMCSFSACSDDDDDNKSADIATKIAGDYAGNLTAIGYQGDAKAYITLTRKSSTAVSCEVTCDEYNLHLSAVILDIEKSNSGYKLSSATKAVSGSVVGKSLSLTFKVSDDTFTFSGSK